MPVPPKVPSAFNRSQFGKDVMKWGTGDAVARARIGTLTLAELQNAGVTAEMARQWRDFYTEEARRTPTNPSARGRIELMQRALELLEENNG